MRRVKERLTSGEYIKVHEGDDHGCAYLSVDGANKCIDVLEDLSRTVKLKSVHRAVGMCRRRWWAII